MWFSRLFWKLFLVYASVNLALIAGFAFIVAAANDPADLQRRGWMVTLAVGVIAVGATYVAVGRIVRPLTQLTEGAQAIAAGDEEHPVYVQTHDELGLLGAAFNHMQHKLHRRLAQLRENSERLATVLGSMVEGVIAVDTEQRILLANDAGRTLLDFVTTDAIGRPLLEVTRSRPVHDAVRSVFENGKPVHREFESPGTTRRVLSLRATRLPGDPCPGVMVVLHDVSELRRLENLRRELVANVSHELKTPLASIKAYAETLRLGAIDDPEHNMAFVGRIEEQAERLHQLILDLLQIARIEAGQETFDVAPVPIADIVETSLSQHAGVADQKRIRLILEAPSAPLAAMADDEGLLTILNNLIDNAIKYTPEEGSVTIRWREAENSMVLIEVEDTGIGIAPPDQARVFERFFRVDKARSRELGGTGLGLSIVKHLVQAFHGTVGLASKPKQGTTFRISLPRA
jgi:two-component system, OmpR family, phosphate regulon sensor histidine kinase PhoR